MRRSGDAGIFDIPEERAEIVGIGLLGAMVHGKTHMLTGFALQHVDHAFFTVETDDGFAFPVAECLAVIKRGGTLVRFNATMNETVAGGDFGF